MGAHVTKLVLENADKTERRDVLHHWFAKTTVGHYNILIVILYKQTILSLLSRFTLILSLVTLSVH